MLAIWVCQVFAVCFVIDFIKSVFFERNVEHLKRENTHIDDIDYQAMHQEFPNLFPWPRPKR